MLRQREEWSIRLGFSSGCKPLAKSLHLDLLLRIDIAERKPVVSPFW